MKNPKGQSAGNADFALGGDAFIADPYPTYEELVATGTPVFDHRRQSWLVCGYEQVEQVLRDPRLSNKTERTLPGFDLFVAFSDPPDHGRMRTAMNRGFLAIMDGLEATVARNVDLLLDELEGVGEFDFLERFAVPLPIAVISQMLGVPARDGHRIATLSCDLFLDASVPAEERVPRMAAATQGLQRYFFELIETGPELGMMASIIETDVANGQMSREELVANAILLMFAGHETTVNLLGTGLLLLLQRPAMVEEIRRNPELLPIAIEEALRFEAPVQMGTVRGVIAPLEIGGRQFVPGDLITPVFAAANRDPGMFADPHTFSLTRKGPVHLGFSAGAHRCMGAQVARVEARVAISRLLARLPTLHLAQEKVVEAGWRGTLRRLTGGAEAEVTPKPQWRANLAIRGLKHLRIAV